MSDETKTPEMGVTQEPRKTPKQLKEEYLAKYQALCREYGYAISGKTILEVVEV